jgi:hypothetical protein
VVTLTRCVGVIAALRWASTLGRSPFGLAFRQYIRPQPKTLSLGPSSSTPSARGRQAVVFVWFRIGRLTLSTSSPTRRLGVVLPRRLNRFAGGEIRSSCIAERREEAANQIFDQEGASHGGGSFPSIFGEKDGARTPARGLHGCARSGPGASSVTQPPTGYDVLPSIKGSPKPIINFFTRFTFFFHPAREGGCGTIRGGHGRRSRASTFGDKVGTRAAASASSPCARVRTS